VIGIIALLISILLPSLGKAREAANRTKCLANLRQLGLGMRFYADANGGQVPLANRNNFGDHSFYVWHGDRAYGWGILMLQGWQGTNGPGGSWKSYSYTNPQTLYCPSVNDPRFQYNSDQNPWKPWNGGTLRVRAGYHMRSDDNEGKGFQIRDDVHPWHAGPHVRYGTQQIVDTVPATVTPLTTTFPVKFPLLNKFKSNKAIASDLLALNWIRSTHKAGVNVLFADGSASWNQLSVLGSWPASLSTNTPDGGPMDWNGSKMHYSYNRLRN
jgi:prepilin-type processing-associated H-X9-DG protein